MSTLLATTKTLNNLTPQTSPLAITDSMVFADASGNLYRITWQNIAIALGARAAVDLNNIQLAYTVLGKIPSALLDTVPEVHQGDWLADNTAPVLSDGAGTNGHYYNVTNANGGTVAQGAGTLAINGNSVAVGDKLVYSSTSGEWYLISQVANFLDGQATAPDCRTALDVYSTGEVDNRTNASDSSATTLQDYRANGVEKWDLRGDGRRVGVHVRQNSPGRGYEQLAYVSIADAGTAELETIFLGNARGYLDVTNSNGAGQGWAKLVIESSAADPDILHDRHTLWTTTKDTASKINIYRDGADSNKLKIQNNTGTPINLTLRLLGGYLA